MKFTLVALFATAAIAVPTGGHGGSGGGSTTTYQPCPNGLFSNAQCCATDVLGVIGLNCAAPDNTPKSKSDFTSICAAKGQQARCCVLPVAGQNVLCTSIV